MTVGVHHKAMRSLFRSVDKQPTGLDLAYMKSARFWTRWPRSPARYRSLAAQAASMGDTLHTLSEDELDCQLDTARARIKNPRQACRCTVGSLAVVREAARRELDLTAYPVQLHGAAAILNGDVAEMATGEGKTLTIAIAAVLSAWSARGCHVMTANDYLASRDAQWAEPLMKRCGLSVSTITSESTDQGRRSGYRADIVYTTPREVAADYLRDCLDAGACHTKAEGLIGNLSGGSTSVFTPRLHHFDRAIVDEADAVLIDDAVTPLILSGASENHIDGSYRVEADSIARGLQVGKDYSIDLGTRGIYLTDEASHRIRSTGGLDATTASRSGRMLEELVVSALIAHHHYSENRDYTILDNRVVIIDPSTGRLMPERSYRGGLHQALEIKHGLEPGPLQESLASISFQRFFAKYASLAGATGTAREVASELWEIYTLRVAPVPTNKAVDRKTMRTELFTNMQEKHSAIAVSAIEMSKRGRAVLIGCQTVESSEQIAQQIHARGGQCAVLNAVRHKEEALVVAQAGQPGRITIATSMAGRGTDIRVDLTVLDQGGLHVILAEPMRSKRLERQFIGRCARQGEPGTSQAYLSREDALFERVLPGIARGAPSESLLAVARLGQRISERRARAIRRQVMLDDEKTDELLGFSGTPF